MDRKRKSDTDRPDVRPASDKVRRCLFGRANEQEKNDERRKYEEDNLSNLEKMKEKYGYDFVEDKQLHLKDTPYTVVKIIEAPCEKDLNGEGVSSTPAVEKHTSVSVVTPNKQCLEKDDSDSKISTSNSVNSTLNERTENGERNCTCEIDKAFVQSNEQSS